MTEREHSIDTIRERLAASSSPRWRMSIVVVIAGAAGFPTSYAMLHAEVTRMVVRYPASVAIARAGRVAQAAYPNANSIGRVIERATAERHSAR